MNCKIDGCDRDAMYQKQQVCQKHYFRKMRYGSYELVKPQYKVGHSCGYIQVREPSHILANSRGYVYEHRFVYYEQVSKEINSCDMCGISIGWGDAHIDHIDHNRKNNNPSNLRPLCNGCNTWRDRDSTKDGQQFTYEGKTQNAGAWAKEDSVEVCRNTILRRRNMGMSDEDALFSKKITHNKKKIKEITENS